MYDYIIVGAGSAGSVLANRLSAAPDRSVLLLEAGGEDDRREINIPAAFATLFKTELDWEYYTEPEPGAAGRRLYWPRGRVLGGSSAINAMIYIRGHPHVFDQWAAAGNPGWSYDDLLPYFKKSEDQARGASPYHATGGPLPVADLRTPNLLSRAFVYAAMAAGLPANGDFNGAQQDGVGFYQVTQRGGQRVSAAAAYLTPIRRRRPNLTVATHARVERILLEEKRARGVVYGQDGARHEARARREIILCGGAVNSPQLLLLSGIGPGAALRELGIDVRVDLPGVGQNLHDHPAYGLTHDVTQPISLANAESLRSLADYMLWKRGPLTSNVAEAGGFVRLDAAAPMPDMQFHFGPVYFVDHGFENPEGHGFTIGATVVAPRSRGTLSLRSPDPADPPCLQPNYFAHPADMATMIAGVRLARRIAAQQAFAPYRGPERFPGPERIDDAALEEAIRARFQTLYHPVGTCKMGTDPLAVVDPQLRVHGVAGLRVVDASIMPTITNGNTNAPTMAIAEKGAVLILGSEL